MSSVPPPTRDVMSSEITSTPSLFLTVNKLTACRIFSHDRDLDMIMLAVFNGAERTRREFESLLQVADRRLRMTKFVKPEGSAMSIIEIALEG